MTPRLLVLFAAAGVASWCLGPAYRRLLATLTEFAFALFGQRVEVWEITLLAPLDLALFVALLTTLPGGATRRHALLLGVPMLVFSEVMLSMSLVLAAALASAGRPLPAALARVHDTLLSSYAWALPLALWALFRFPARSPRPSAG